MRHKWKAILSFFIVSAFIIIVGSTHGAVPSGWKSENLEEEVYRLVNQHRSQQGLPGLKWNEMISKEARNHSRNMAFGKIKLSHEGFDDRIARIRKKIDLSKGAENVALNQGAKDPPEEAIQTWLNSPGHRANIEGEYDMTGVGIAKNKEGRYYFTQIFIKKRTKD